MSSAADESFMFDSSSMAPIPEPPTTLTTSVGGRRKLMSALSLFNQESHNESEFAEPAVEDSPAAVDSDDSSSKYSSSPPTHELELVSLAEVELHTSPSVTRNAQSTQRYAIQNIVDEIERNFMHRVAAHPLSPMNISPGSRERFERMVWTLLIIGQPRPVDRDGVILPLPSIPVIKPAKFYDIKLPSSTDAGVVKLTMEEYFIRTEALVRIYSMPYHVATKLAEVATEINNSKFARYMGSRGHWSLHHRFGGLLVLLRWWGATSPAFLNDYASLVRLKADSTDTLTRQMLRLEVRELLDMDTDPDEEDYDTSLDVVISRGLNKIARLRRELQVVVQDSFEDLVARAQEAGVGFHREPLPSTAE